MSRDIGRRKGQEWEEAEGETLPMISFNPFHGKFLYMVIKDNFSVSNDNVLHRHFSVINVGCDDACR